MTDTPQHDSQHEIQESLNPAIDESHDERVKRGADFSRRTGGTITAAAVTVGTIAGAFCREGANLTGRAGDISERIEAYFRTHDAAAIANDAMRTAKQYPAQSLVLATAIGFLLERSLLRRVKES